MNKIVCFLLLITSQLFAQVGGQSIYNFLNIANSSRQAALGGKIISLIDDVNQPNWNPSIINSDITNQLGLNYVNYLADISLVSVSFSPKINDEIGNIYAGLSYMNYGDFIKADEEGVELGSFKAYDMLLTVGYAYNLPRTNLYVGSNLKAINSVIENYSSVGVAMDLGVSYINSDKPYTISLALRNFGSQITVYDEEKENLPTEVILGASYKLENVPITWHMALDNLQNWDISISNPSNTSVDLDGNERLESISFLDNTLRHFSFGAELFTEKSFNLRFGYNFRRSKELMLIDKRTFAGFTAGFGLKLNKFKFNYAFSKYHPASNVNTFSLLINLN